jgi:DNA polymerase III epsilon subunit-like protein
MVIRIIDLETTGIDPTAHVVEIGSVDLLPDGTIARHQEHLAAIMQRFDRFAVPSAAFA